MNKIVQRLLLTNLTVILAGSALLVFLLRIPSTQYPLVLACGVFVAAILSFLVSRFFFRPIKQMKKAMEKIRQGDFQNRLDLAREDELGELAQHLHEVSVDMQSKIMEIMDDKNELKAILSSMAEGVMVISADENILLMNAPVYEMLELRSREAVGKHYWEVIRNEEINSLLKAAVARKHSIKKEITLIAPEESQFSIQVSPVHSNSGDLAGIVVVFHDITEIKKLARLRSEFVANVSHELKTPLTSIKGFVETLQESALDDRENAKKFLDIIQKHAQRLENLVDDLLSLSALETKEVAINLEKTDLAAVIEATINLCKDRLQQKRQKWTIRIPPEIPPVTIDRPKMEQAFLNLLDNASKFTPDNGTITVSAALEENFVRVDVQDTGIGIEARHLPRIFERFYRIDKGRSREMGGTGLGLAIVKHTVQRHGGKVAVQSQPDQGSTFSVFLPTRFPAGT